MPKETVAVIGLGYVGLPVACVLADAGFRTIGIDIDVTRVKSVNVGVSPFASEEPGLEELLQAVAVEGALRAFADIRQSAEADAFIICVDTPIGPDRRTRLDVLTKVCQDIGRIIKKGALVSIESTLPPKTMEDVVIPALQAGKGLKAGKDFSVVHCPERVMPGRLLHNLRHYSRVIGALDEPSLEKALYYYSKIVDAELHPTDLLSAEIAKTAENTYRDVQIAFANEVALICERLGADAFEVRRLVNTCPYRDMHVPGAGVGGHCLPKDPWLLIENVPKDQARLIPIARGVNDYMPKHMAELAEEGLVEAERPLRSARITVLGLAFLRDVDDTRNSPAKPIIDQLIAKGADVIVHDQFAKQPYVAPLERDLRKALLGSDCAIFVTDHSAYRNIDLEDVKELMRTPVIVDGRNLFSAEMCRQLGFVYKGIGKGKGPLT